MKLINKLSIVLVLCGMVALASCHPNHGDPGIDKKEMISILIDVHIAQALVTRQTTVPPASFNKDQCYKAVLDKHHVTAAQFDSAVAWYARNAGEYKIVYQAVIDSLTNRRNNVH